MTNTVANCVFQQFLDALTPYYFTNEYVRSKETFRIPIGTHRRDLIYEVRAALLDPCPSTCGRGFFWVHASWHQECFGVDIDLAVGRVEAQVVRRGEVPMAIRVKARSGESTDQMMKRFKKLCEREGLIKDIKRKEFYEKPSERRRRAARKSVSRRLRPEIVERPITN